MLISSLSSLSRLLLHQRGARLGGSIDEGRRQMLCQGVVQHRHRLPQGWLPLAPFCRQEAGVRRATLDFPMFSLSPIGLFHEMSSPLLRRGLSSPHRPGLSRPKDRHHRLGCLHGALPVRLGVPPEEVYVASGGSGLGAILDRQVEQGRRVWSSYPPAGSLGLKHVIEWITVLHLIDVRNGPAKGPDGLLVYLRIIMPPSLR